MTLEHAAEAVEQAAATGGTATRIAAVRLAAAAGLTSTALFAAAALLFATTARFTTTMTAQQAEERIRASGCAEHQGDAQRRKGST
jgi:hypothetical protein